MGTMEEPAPPPEDIADDGNNAGEEDEMSKRVTTESYPWQK